METAPGRRATSGHAGARPRRRTSGDSARRCRTRAPATISAAATAAPRFRRGWRVRSGPGQQALASWPASIASLTSLALQRDDVLALLRERTAAHDRHRFFVLVGDRDVVDARASLQRNLARVGGQTIAAVHGCQKVDDDARRAGEFVVAV